MKKVIALTLVMSAAAFAADLNVRIDGPTEMAIGETAQVKVVLEPTTDALLNGNMLMNVTGDGNANITGIAMDAMYLNVTGDLDPSDLLAAEGYYPSFVGLAGLPVMADTMILTFDIEATTAGEVTIGLYPHNVPQPQYAGKVTEFNHPLGSFGGTITPLTIAIPEPASLALLAIGGLAVIRRR